MLYTAAMGVYDLHDRDCRSALPTYRTRRLRTGTSGAIVGAPHKRRVVQFARSNHEPSGLGFRVGAKRLGSLNLIQHSTSLVTRHLRTGWPMYHPPRPGLPRVARDVPNDLPHGPVLCTDSHGNVLPVCRGASWHSPLLVSPSTIVTATEDVPPRAGGARADDARVTGRVQLCQPGPALSHPPSDQPVLIHDLPRELGTLSLGPFL